MAGFSSTVTLGDSIIPNELEGFFAKHRIEASAPETNAMLQVNEVALALFSEAAA
jgi:hypothetical protein